MSASVNNEALSKGWKRFTIMHLDRRVVSVREDGTCTFYAKKFMPLNLYLEEAGSDDIDTRINNLNNFYYWCASRVLTLDRKYAKEILNSIGARQTATDRDRALVAISYHGLSLTDVYWIMTNRESVSFSEISLYRHSLSGAFAGVSLFGKQLTAQNSELLLPGEVAGDVGTQGVSPKAWIREKDGFYLLKDGDLRDVKAELLASQIARRFAVESISYEPAVFDGRSVTKCRNYTSEDRGIVSAEYVNIYCQNRETDFLGFVLKKDAYSYYMMNIVDYLVGNTDRHWGNWGFSVDNRTNGIQKLYPLMDFNKSFTAYDSVEGARCLTTERQVSQREAAVEAVRKIGLNLVNEVEPGLFEDDEIGRMFYKRLEILKAAE